MGCSNSALTPVKPPAPLNALNASVNPDVYGNRSGSRRIAGIPFRTACDAGSPAEEATSPSWAAVRYRCAQSVIDSVASPSTSVVRASVRSLWSLASPTSERSPNA